MTRRLSTTQTTWPVGRGNWGKKEGVCGVLYLGWMCYCVQLLVYVLCTSSFPPYPELRVLIYIYFPISRPI